MKLATPEEVVLSTFYTTFPYLNAWKDFKICADIASHWVDTDFYPPRCLVRGSIWIMHDNPVDLQLFWFALQYLVKNKPYNLNSLQHKLHEWICQHYPLYSDRKKYNVIDELALFDNPKTGFSYVDIYKSWGPTFPEDGDFYPLASVVSTYNAVHALECFYSLFIKSECLDYNDYVVQCLETNKPVNVSTYMEWRKTKLPRPFSTKEYEEVVKQRELEFPFK